MTDPTPEPQPGTVLGQIIATATAVVTDSDGNVIEQEETTS